VIGQFVVRRRHITLGFFSTLLVSSLALIAEYSLCKQEHRKASREVSLGAIYKLRLEKKGSWNIRESNWEV